MIKQPRAEVQLFMDDENSPHIRVIVKTFKEDRSEQSIKTYPADQNKLGRYIYPLLHQITKQALAERTTIPGQVIYSKDVSIGKPEQSAQKILALIEEKATIGQFPEFYINVETDQYPIRLLEHHFQREINAEKAAWDIAKNAFQHYSPKTRIDCWGLDDIIQAFDDYGFFEETRHGFRSLEAAIQAVDLVRNEYADYELTNGDDFYNMVRDIYHLTEPVDEPDHFYKVTGDSTPKTKGELLDQMQILLDPFKHYTDETLDSVLFEKVKKHVTPITRDEAQEMRETLRANAEKALKNLKERKEKKARLREEKQVEDARKQRQQRRMGSIGR